MQGMNVFARYMHAGGSLDPSLLTSWMLVLIAWPLLGLWISVTCRTSIIRRYRTLSALVISSFVIWLNVVLAVAFIAVRHHVSLLNCAYGPVWKSALKTDPGRRETGAEFVPT
jgi:hypothetical protein